MIFKLTGSFLFLIIPYQILASSSTGSASSPEISSGSSPQISFTDTSCSNGANGEAWSTINQRCEPYTPVYARLVGTDPTKRLEVTKDNQTWGTVCGDFFDNADAKVVCRSLGVPVDSFPGQLPVAVRSKHTEPGLSHMHIFLDNVGCNGMESNLGACFSPPLDLVWNITDCAHSEDVGVYCGCQKGYRKMDNGECKQCIPNCDYCSDMSLFLIKNPAIPSMETDQYFCNTGGCAGGMIRAPGGTACISKNIQDVLKHPYAVPALAAMIAVGAVCLLGAIINCWCHHCKNSSKDQIAHRESSKGQSVSKKSTNDDIKMDEK